MNNTIKGGSYTNMQMLAIDLDDPAGTICHKSFDLYFFHESNPSGPLIDRLKWFFLKIRFCQDI